MEFNGDYNTRLIEFANEYSCGQHKYVYLKIVIIKLLEIKMQVKRCNIHEGIPIVLVFKLGGTIVNSICGACGMLDTSFKS